MNIGGGIMFDTSLIRFRQETAEELGQKQGKLLACKLTSAIFSKDK